MSTVDYNIHGRKMSGNSLQRRDNRNRARTAAEDDVNKHYADRDKHFEESLKKFDATGELGHMRDMWQTGKSPTKTDLDEVILAASHLDGSTLMAMGTGTDAVDNPDGYVAVFDEKSGETQELSKDDAKMLVMISGLKNAGLTDSEINKAMQNWYQLPDEQKNFVLDQMTGREVHHHVELHLTTVWQLKKFDHRHYHADTSTPASKSQMRMAHYLAHVEGSKRDFVEQIANWDVAKDPDGITTFLGTIDGWDQMTRDQQASLVDYLRNMAGYEQVDPKTGQPKND